MKFSETKEGKQIIRDFHRRYHVCDSEKECLQMFGRLIDIANSMKKSSK